MEAVRATPEERALLQIEEGEPCLLINRRTRSTQHIVSFARLLFRLSLPFTGSFYVVIMRIIMM